MPNPSPNRNTVRYVPAGTGPTYFGPGDRVTFLATGAETHGSFFMIEALAAPGGGPPPHLHHFEDESFYVLEGSITFEAGSGSDSKTIRAKPGDFIHIPSGTMHSFRNEGTTPARAIVIISPAGRGGGAGGGMQRFFEESFTLVKDRNAAPPPISEELMKRMMAASARNGLEWLPPPAPPGQ